MAITTVTTNGFVPVLRGRLSTRPRGAKVGTEPTSEFGWANQAVADLFEISRYICALTLVGT